MYVRIVAGGLIGGVAGGIVVAAIQAAVTTPLILHAEIFEAAQAAAGHAAHAGHGHGDAVAHHAGAANRHIMTAIMTVAVATGYAWMLLAAMTAKGKTITARSVVPWAFAGFVATGLAPAMGLAPELPGAASADLMARQAWWFGVVLATAVGIAVMAAETTLPRCLVGVGLIVAPHLVGAPRPEVFESRVPAEIAAAFAARSLVLHALIWIVPASVAGFAIARLEAAGPKLGAGA